MGAAFDSPGLSICLPSPKRTAVTLFAAMPAPDLTRDVTEYGSFYRAGERQYSKEMEAEPARESWPGSF